MKTLLIAIAGALAAALTLVACDERHNLKDDIISGSDAIMEECMSQARLLVATAPRSVIDDLVHFRLEVLSSLDECITSEGQEWAEGLLAEECGLSRYRRMMNLSPEEDKCVAGVMERIEDTTEVFPEIAVRYEADLASLEAEIVAAVAAQSVATCAPGENLDAVFVRRGLGGPQGMGGVFSSSIGCKPAGK